MAANLLKSASIGTSTNTALVSALEKGSETLANISKAFVARSQDMIIHTFYETEKIHGVIVVDRQSTVTGLENERLFPVNANHRIMCKMPSSTSHQYKTVGFGLQSSFKGSLQMLFHMAKFPKPTRSHTIMSLTAEFISLLDKESCADWIRRYL